VRFTNEIFVSFIYSYCLNNPLKYFDPGGMTYYKLEGNEWILFEYNPFSVVGVDFRTASGGGIALEGPSYEELKTNSGNVANGEYGLPGQSYGEGTNGPGVGGIYYDCVSNTLRLVDKPEAGGFYIEANAFEAFTVGLLNNPSVQGGREPIIGLSVDATLAIVSLGYTVEGGFYTNGKESSQFLSHGQTFGVEASAGFNFILIKPKDNFKFNDLEGMGTSAVINFWILSISVLGNSSPGYPENSVFDTYWGIKIGIGPGAGGSYAPNSNTSFHDWIPDYSQSFFHWR